MAKHNTKAKNRLAKRIADFDSMKGEGSQGNSKWVNTQGGKPTMFHRPGSLKK